MESVNRSPIYAHFSETIAGAATIRGYKEQERFQLTSINLINKNVRFFHAFNATKR